MRIAFLLALSLLSTCLLADTVVFSNGQELEGKVLEQDETSVLLEVEYGTMRIEKSRIERVDPDTPEKLAQRESARAAREASAAKLAETAAKPKPKATAIAPAKPAQKPALAANRNAPGNVTAGNASAASRVSNRGSNRGGVNQGNVPNNMARRQGNTGRARMPNAANQLPGGIQDLAKKYLGGRGR